MKADMDRREYVKNLLAHHTCAAFDGNALLTSQKRGVSPLLGWLEEGIRLEGFWVADRVVGKGAAFLYLLLGAKKLHAGVISRPAKALLEEKGVDLTFDDLVDGIRNRDNTGFCPIETAVLPVSDPQEALAAIRKRLEELKK